MFLLTDSLDLVWSNHEECVGEGLFRDGRVCRKVSYFDLSERGSVCEKKPLIKYEQVCVQVSLLFTCLGLVLWLTRFFFGAGGASSRSRSGSARGNSGGRSTTIPSLPTPLETSPSSSTPGLCTARPSVPSSSSPAGSTRVRRARPFILRTSSSLTHALLFPPDFRLNDTLDYHIRPYLTNTSSLSPRPISLWSAYTAPTSRKPKKFLAKQGPEAVQKFNREIRKVLPEMSPGRVEAGAMRSLEWFGVTDGAASYDGTHHSYQVSLILDTGRYWRRQSERLKLIFLGVLVGKVNMEKAQVSC